MISQKISFNNKRVLVCPLDWGLGHTSRCVPLIKALQEAGNTVVVGCNSLQKNFMQDEISNTVFVDLFGYEVKYSENAPLWMSLLFQFSRLKRVVKREHEWLENFLKENKIDVVISDNRFGLYSEKVETIFMTHQVFIKAPFSSRYINSFNRSYIKNFGALWIADYEAKEKSLAGELSHGTHFHNNVTYIGALSRFTKKDVSTEKTFDALVLLSGVEPQRTLLEEKCFYALQNLKICIVRGTNAVSKINYPPDHTVVNVAKTTDLEKLLLSSKKIICRSGYSSLMDLHALGLKAILIPTPGQTEQEYLSKYWKENYGFQTLNQKEVSRESLLKAISG